MTPPRRPPSIPPAPDDALALLRERARRLARPIERADAGEVLEVLELRLAGERYAFETRFAIEVLARPDVAYLPGATPPLVGIAAWRGELIPVLDLFTLLRVPHDGADAEHLLVLGGERPAFAVGVPSSIELRDVPASGIGPLPGGDPGARPFLTGVTADALMLVAAAELIRTHSAGARS